MKRIHVAGIALAAIALLAACAAPAATPTAPVTSPAASPAQSLAPVSSASPTATVDDPQALLDAARARYGAPGAVAAIGVGGTRIAVASGTADLRGSPLRPDARFRIASITKPIVATLVLDAVARGKVSLDSSVADLLPGVVRADPPITVRMILNHTSGVFDEGNEGDPVADVALLADPALKAEGLDDIRRLAAGEKVIASGRVLIALAETHPRYFAPGTGYHYSNINYQIAAELVGKVTGETLADLLRTRIAQPLGLARTTIAPPDLSSPELRGYDDFTPGSSPVDVTDDLTGFGNGGNGGVMSTADELLTIVEAITSGRLLPAPLVADMKTPARNSYGLGLATYTLPCGTFYGHEGSVLGTRSIALANDNGTDGVVVAMNIRTNDDPVLVQLGGRLLCPRV